MKRIFFSFLILLFSLRVAEAQNQIIAPFPINISLQRMAADKKGTDARNIFHITVDFTGDQFRNSTPYTVLYKVDGLPIEEFRRQALPYTFTRNFKGIADGSHVLQIDIEDGNGNVLATGEAAIDVDHNRKIEDVAPDGQYPVADR